MSTERPPPVVHAFRRADASYGRAPCGVYLARGWLDATDDRETITCIACLAIVDRETPASDTEDPAET